MTIFSLAWLYPPALRLEPPGRALLVDGSKQPLPLSVHPDTRLVDPPGAAGVALVPADLLLQPRGVALNPPPDGRVINHDAAFRHHLLELAIAYRVFAVPADALQDDEGMEAAKLEGVHSGIPKRSWLRRAYLNPHTRQCNSAL